MIRSTHCDSIVYWFWKRANNQQSLKTKESTHHPNCSRFELVHQSSYLVSMLAVYRSSQTIASVVGHSDSLLLGLEWDDDDDWTEYLLLCLMINE